MPTLHNLMLPALAAPVLLLFGSRSEDHGLAFAPSPYAARACAPTSMVTGAVDLVVRFGLEPDPVVVLPLPEFYSTDSETLNCSVQSNATERQCSVPANAKNQCTTKSGEYPNGHNCSVFQGQNLRISCSVIGKNASTKQCSTMGGSSTGQWMNCSVIGTSSGVQQCSVLEGGENNKGRCSSFSDSATQRCSVIQSTNSAKCSVESGSGGSCTTFGGAAGTCSTHASGATAGCSTITSTGVRTSNTTCSG